MLYTDIINKKVWKQFKNHDIIYKNRPKERQGGISVKGIYIRPQEEYRAAFQPHCRQAETSCILSAGGLEASIFQMHKGVSGCFEQIANAAQAEMYYIVSGKIKLSVLHEAVHFLQAGDFFGFSGNSESPLFTVLEDTEFLCVANRSYYARDRQLTQTLEILLSELQAKDGDTRTHCERVRLLAMQIAQHMPGFDASQLETLLLSARFHDVGKCKIPLEILIKPGRLTDAEYEIMKQHSIYSEEMALQYLNQNVADVLRHHHERWDGHGYPDRLAGTEIPLCARVIAVADAYDAMVITRPYHAGMPADCAVAELRKCAGTQFDPDCVTAFIDSLADVSSEEQENAVLQTSSES